MRVRKVAKQLKRQQQSLMGWDDDGLPVYAYRMRQRLRGWRYIMRMTRRHYFGLLDRRAKPSMMQNLYIHKACSPYLFDDILEFWGIREKRE